MARQRCRFVAIAGRYPAAGCQTPSDAERLQKLEQAVSQLQKRNAELEQEITGLKKRSAWAPVLTSEGKTKTQVTSDGKTYVEKLVPELAGAEKWKLFPAITELELFGDLHLRYEYRGGRLPSNDPDHPNDWQDQYQIFQADLNFRF